jgi:hypothetical protein
MNPFRPQKEPLNWQDCIYFLLSIAISKKRKYLVKYTEWLVFVFSEGWLDVENRYLQ